MTYEERMLEWRRRRHPDWMKPRADFQRGSHIDSLPVEKRPPRLRRGVKLIPVLSPERRCK